MFILQQNWFIYIYTCTCMTCITYTSNKMTCNQASCHVSPSCHYSKFTSPFKPSKNAESADQQRTVLMTSSDFLTANLNLLSNASPAVTALDDCHSVYILNESLKYYHAQRLSFVQGKGKTSAGTCKSIIFVMKKGLLLKNPVKAEFVS